MSLLLVVKNHSNESYEKFLYNLKKYGVIEIDEDGDVKFLTLEIPVLPPFCNGYKPYF